MHTARALMFRIAVSASLAAAILACSSTTLRPAGYSCTSDAQCSAGLSCLGLVGLVGDAGVCKNAAMACSKTCSLDSDCAAVGSTFRCFPACDGTKSCGQTP